MTEGILKTSLTIWRIKLKYLLQDEQGFRNERAKAKNTHGAKSRNAMNHAETVSLKKNNSVKI